MHRIKNLFIILAAGVMLSSCATTVPFDVTDNEMGTKTGKSSYTVILGFPPFNGNAGIKEAAENGNIDKIATVDRKLKSGFFTTTYVTVVTGE